MVGNYIKFWLFRKFIRSLNKYEKYIRNIQFLDFCFLVGEVRSECEWTVMIENHLNQLLSWERLLTRALGH